MTDTEKNRRVVEWLGMCAVCDDRVCELIEECGCDFFTDPLELLRLMRKRKSREWVELLNAGLGATEPGDSQVGIGGYEMIEVYYLLAPGALLYAVDKWIGREEGVHQ